MSIGKADTGHEGRRYAIVGGTAGMGLATARLLAAAGASVAILGRNAERAKAIAADLAVQTGGTVIGEGGAGALLGPAVERAAAGLGGLDGLAVTAGPIHSRGRLTELSDADWGEMVDTQLMSVVRATRAAIPLLVGGGGGAIVTTAAMSVRLAKPVLPHYAAMKAAIASLTKSIALTYGGQGIRANCVAPGAIATEALDAAQAEASATMEGAPLVALWRLMQRDWGVKAALDRIGEPGEVAELYAFLLSPQAGYLTGALINIDGGSDF